MGNFLKAFTWIKPEDFENLTKVPKHDKQTSLSLKKEQHKPHLNRGCSQVLHIYTCISNSNDATCETVSAVSLRTCDNLIFRWGMCVPVFSFLSAN